MYEKYEDSTNFLDSESDPKYPFLKIQEVKSLEVINTATWRTRSVRVTIRSETSLVSATIETGSPASFINKKTADILKQKYPDARLRTTHEKPIRKLYMDYNHKPIKLFGTLLGNKKSNRCYKENAEFLVSEYRTGVF